MGVGFLGTTCVLIGAFLCMCRLIYMLLMLPEILNKEDPLSVVGVVFQLYMFPCSVCLVLLVPSTCFLCFPRSLNSDTDFVEEEVIVAN